MNKKYPRTPHLPWSESVSTDDVKIIDDSHFEGKEIVITEKMDGECTGMTNEICHARSLNSRHHPSRSWVKQLHSSIQSDIPMGWKIFGENMFAYHSILYFDLPSYFMCYSVYDESDFCLSWDQTEELCELLGLVTVPVLYRGIYDSSCLKNIWNGKGTYPTFTTGVEYPQTMNDFAATSAEGYVIRTSDGFHYDEFKKCVAKYVRKNHVQPNQGHWQSKPVTPNVLVGQDFLSIKD